MTKLAIFDLDGTLLNTVADLGHATNHSLRGCGFPERPLEDYKTLCGRGIRNMFRDALPPDAATGENIEKVRDMFLPYYDTHMCDLTKPYDGITEMLGRLTASGVRLAVASNKYQEGAEKLIRQFFGEFPFVKILGQREGLPIKPDPAIVDQIMAEIPGLGKEEVVYAGDSDVDMHTGNNAGVRTVGVTWGFRSREELASCNPWKIADTPGQLAGYILNHTSP